MTVSEKIYEIMAAKKMKQSLVAAAAGYEVKVFNNMLKGRKKINAEEIYRVCVALEVSPNDLFDYKPRKAQ